MVPEKRAVLAKMSQPRILLAGCNVIHNGPDPIRQFRLPEEANR